MLPLLHCFDYTSSIHGTITTSSTAISSINTSPTSAADISINTPATTFANNNTHSNLITILSRLFFIQANKGVGIQSFSKNISEKTHKYVNHLLRVHLKKTSIIKCIHDLTWVIRKHVHIYLFTSHLEIFDVSIEQFIFLITGLKHATPQWEKNATQAKLWISRISPSTPYSATHIKHLPHNLPISKYHIYTYRHTICLRVAV